MSTTPTLTLTAYLGLLLVAAAARSTWSPCGLSMLSSITPLGESGRGHTFRSTASWYIAGGVVGGASLGAVMALAAWGVHGLAPSGTVTCALAALVCLGAVLLDSRVFGARIPLLRRQVNEVWLDRYRRQVYGFGFGWQIGVGFTTYVMTAAVIALVPLAALSARPWVAFGVGTAFGTLRGLTVLTGRHITGPAGLRAAHRRLHVLEIPVWAVVRVTLGVGAVLFGFLALGPLAAAGLFVAAAAAVGYGLSIRRRTAAQAAGLHHASP